MRKRFTIKVPIYECKIVLILEDGFSKSDLKLLDGIDFSRFDGFCAKDENNPGHYLVYFESREIRLDIITHETIHLVNMIMTDHNIIIDPDNDEPQAYLAGWLFRQIATKMRLI